MANESMHREPRRAVDRRRDLGRRIIRDRRREWIEVPTERRSGTDRRVVHRRGYPERRTPPEGFRSPPGY